MSAVRWTGKGLKLLGSILENKEVEEWLEEKGQEIVERHLENLVVKSVAGQKRAVKSARSTIIDDITRSRTLNSAIAKELEYLPALVGSVSYNIYNRGPAFYHHSKASNYAVACPRAPIQRIYVNHVVGTLENSAELRRYEGLPRRFLSRIALQSEGAFFSRVRKLKHGVLLPGGNSVLIDVDESYEWGYKRSRGHYYVIGTNKYGAKVEERDKKRFAAALEPIRDELCAKLGRASEEQIDRAVRGLRKA